MKSSPEQAEIDALQSSDHLLKGLLFDDAGHRDVSTESIFAAFDKSLGAPPVVPQEAAKVVTADYRVPFLAHATMEPMVCTARVEGERAEIWAGVQDPLNARANAAERRLI